MDRRVVVGVMVGITGCCDHPQVVSTAAAPSFVSSHAGRFVAGWDQSEHDSGVPDYRYVTNTSWSPIHVPLTSVVASAAGTRTSLLLESGTGTVGPRRVAILYDDHSKVVTIDAPVLDASVVFDGTSYQIVYIDTQNVHVISLDEDGVLGITRTIMPRPSSDSYLVRSGTDSAGQVVAVLPDRDGEDFVALDSADSVQWQVHIPGIRANSNCNPCIPSPVFFNGSYRTLGSPTSSGESLITIGSTGQTSSTAIPGGMDFLLGDSVLFGSMGMSSGLSNVVRVDESLQSFSQTSIQYLSYGAGGEPVRVSANGDHIVGLLWSDTPLPRDLFVLEYASDGTVISRTLVAREGDLTDASSCISTD